MAQVLATGMTVDVQKSANVPLSFSGTVEKLYVNSALVTIDTFDAEDSVTVEDLKGKTVVNYKDMTQDGQPVEPPAPEDGK